MARKLDAAIAKSLGKQVVERNGEWWYPGRIPSKVEQFSNDGNDMLELDAEMRARGLMLMVEVYDEGYSAAYWKVYENKWTDDYDSSAMPEAVALAAYNALSGKEWQK